MPENTSETGWVYSQHIEETTEDNNEEVSTSDPFEMIEAGNYPSATNGYNLTLSVISISGNHVQFHLLLFGKTIIWFSQFLQAFYMLGRQGLGKQHAIYRIIRVENMSGENVVEGDQVWIANLGIDTVRNYAIDRVSKLCEKGFQNTLVFQTPVTIKYQGDFIREFQAEALIRSILRRMYSFDCFEGKDFELMMWDEHIPAIVSQHAFPQSIRRYSSTQGSKMNLYGIAGDVTFDYLPEELLLLFVAGEKLHIGKNTSFGFGKYVVQ